MRQLTVYHEAESIDEPHILSFQELAPEIRRSRFRVVRAEEASTLKLVQAVTAKMARIRHQNEACPSCDRVTVEPIELHDARVTRNGAVLQGSATVVGFSCNACGHEWSV
jgi:hypothetical protein